jgi:hypothetical protein
VCAVREPVRQFSAWLLSQRAALVLGRQTTSQEGLRRRKHIACSLKSLTAVFPLIFSPFLIAVVAQGPGSAVG